MTQASAEPVFRYRAFISYSHQDKTWADWLHKALETYRVPSRLVGKITAAGTIPRRLAPVFRDRDELASATDLGRKVNEALGESANLIVICSPRSALSHWVNEEVLSFKRLGRSERIFCLIVDGEPNTIELPGREAEECFAPALRHPLGSDGQLSLEQTEPIAADVRPGKDGKINAKLKLIAGMLDVGFDQLKQRELQRRYRRMTTVSAVAIAIMLVTTFLAIDAVVARRAAERRQKQAEDLVGFMLGNLSDKLGEVHRLDIMQAVGDKAMAYFASLPSSDVTDAGLAQRVTALEKIGSVRIDQNQLPAALEAYQAAAALAAQLVHRSPGDVARQAAYADSLKWVGQTYWYQGDLQRASQNFKTASALLQQAIAAQPANTDIAFALAMARSNTGQVLQAVGELASAKIEYDEALRILQSLTAKQPPNTLWQSELGYAWDRLGKLALEQGRLDAAIAAYRNDQRIKVALAARDPNNHQAQEDLVVGDAILGRTLALCGKLEAAARYTKQAVDRAKALVAFDPANEQWREYVALYSQQLGGLLRQQGQWDAAAVADNDAIQILSALAAKDPALEELQKELAQSQLESARLQLAKADQDAAEPLAKAALATIQTLLAKDGSDRSLMLLAARAYTVLGQVAAQRHDAAAARDAWVRARDAIAVTARSSDDPNVLSTWAGALLLLDDIDAARPAVAKLASMGYRAPDFVALVTLKQVDYPLDSEAEQRIAKAMN
ncbi:TIR domain-containing protein [Dyella humicola]|uniref:TIR domain-containing protein n=1 Tax=Dyella humicola TaxID=2992126 RepID=UPI002254FA45|nr:TIR domain-containing protein [Dyella humicola]